MYSLHIIPNNLSVRDLNGVWVWLLLIAALLAAAAGGVVLVAVAVVAVQEVAVALDAHPHAFDLQACT